MVKAAIAILLAALIAHGAEESYPDFGFAFTWPDEAGWTVMPAGELGHLVLFSRALLHEETGRVIQVRVLDAPEGVTMADERYLKGLESGILKSIPTLADNQKWSAPFAGVPALHLRFGGTVEDVTLCVASTTLIADGFQYALTASGPGGGQESYVGLPALYEGFRFLKKPVPPVPASDAERWGERIGETIVGPLLLIGIVLLIARLFRRKRARTIEE